MGKRPDVGALAAGDAEVHVLRPRRVSPQVELRNADSALRPVHIFAGARRHIQALAWRRTSQRVSQTALWQFLMACAAPFSVLQADHGS